MKLFIVAAVLVACVAGQTSMDLLKLNKDTRSMLKFDRPVYPMAYDYDYTNRVNMYDDVDTTYNYNYDNVLTYEEMMVHPRFQEYMTLPLFRQYWSYPMFQRYVCSRFFQRFWEIPAFKTYFMNPVLFYKYVYPCVQLFKYNYDTTSTTNYPFTYDTQENMYNYKYNQYPMVCRYNTVYCKAVVENLYQHLYTMMMRMSQDQETMMPYNYNYNTNSMYNNPIIAKMMYGMYNKQYPTVYNYNQRFPSTYETDNTFNYNKIFDFDTLRMPNRMVQDMPTVTDLKFENMRPIQKIPVGMKTFEDKVIPEMINA